MAVRRITNGGRKVIGKVPSLKVGKPVWFESQLEEDYIHHLEIDSNVISYWEQPFKIRYMLKSRIHIYTPDFLVERLRGKQVVEVKMRADAEKEENIALFNRIRPICQKEGYEFAVVTDDQIRMQPRLDNIKLLFRYSRTHLSSTHQIHAYAFFARSKESTLAEMIEFFASKGVASKVVYALIYWGVLWIDLSKPINIQTRVTMPMAGYPALKQEIA